MPEKEVEETTLELVEPLSEHMIDEGVALVPTLSSAEIDPWRDPLASAKSLSVETDAQGDPCAMAKKALLGKGADDSKPNGDYNLFTHLPKKGSG